jgi:hypothetical protein
VSAPSAGRRAGHLVEVLSVILLAAATLATAWAGYQSSRWHGQQAKAQAAATAKRVDATRLSGVANREGQIDVAVFIQWVDARARRETRLADFYSRRFSDRLQPAFKAWLATRPFANGDAPRTPFAMPQYQIGALRRSRRLEAEATAAGEEARVDIQRADNYVLAVVLMASALFFAGLSTRLPTWRGREAILALGGLVFVAGAIWMVTFPVTVAV